MLDVKAKFKTVLMPVEAMISGSLNDTLDSFQDVCMPELLIVVELLIELFCGEFVPPHLIGNQDADFNFILFG